jgi:hypothetical protein
MAGEPLGLGSMWGEEKAREMLAAAGLEVLEVKQAEGDPINKLLHRPEAITEREQQTREQARSAISARDF